MGQQWGLCGKGKVTDLPRGWVEDKADRASEGSSNPTTVEGTVSQAALLWLCGAKRPSHRQAQEAHSAKRDDSERHTIATKASKDSESHIAAQI